MKNLLYIAILSLILLSGINSTLWSQEPIEAKDSVVSKQEAPSAYMTKSGSGALLRSFAVPGWGQLYVESYWKAPIFFGGAATLVYFIIANNSDFDKYNKLYNALSDKTTYDAQVLKNTKEYYRDNRDRSAFYLLGVYALAAVDAYVGAHLYDFSVEDDVSLYLSNKHDGFAINFRYRIK